MDPTFAFSMPGLSMPGLSIPSMSSSASSSLNQAGAAIGVGSGAWSINLGGSGASQQTSSATSPLATSAAGLQSLQSMLPTLLLIAGVAWLMHNHK